MTGDIVSWRARSARFRSAVTTRLVTPTYRLASVIARALPDRVADAVAAGLARVLWRALGDRQQMLRRHQQRLAGGALGPAALERRSKDAIASYAKYWVDAFRLEGKTTAEIDAGIRVTGREHVERALANGTGAIMAMPHIGAWDYGGAWMAQHWPITVVAERLEPPELFEWFCERRNAAGMKVVALGPDAGPVLLAALRANEVVGLLCERDIAGGGIEVEFFGAKTTMPAGPATLALRTGAALLPNAVYQRDGFVEGVIRPPISIERTGKFRADVAALTQLLATELEHLIRAAPEQWHVLQPHWPDDSHT